MWGGSTCNFCWASASSLLPLNAKLHYCFGVFLLYLSSHMIMSHPVFWGSLVLDGDPNSSVWALLCAAELQEIAPSETSLFFGKLRAGTRFHDSSFVSDWFYLTVDSGHMCAGKEWGWRRKPDPDTFPKRRKSFERSKTFIEKTVLKWMPGMPLQ